MQDLKVEVLSTETAFEPLRPQEELQHKVRPLETPITARQDLQVQVEAEVILHLQEVAVVADAQAEVVVEVVHQAAAEEDKPLN